LSLPIGTMTYQSQKRDVQEQDINFHKYMEKTDNETLALGVENKNDFEPGYYEFEPYPGAIEKYIEATAYCYGTTTCTGKPVREGIAAMSKRYLGMTAIVYELDENGQPFEYIGIYEIEDTGGDERIRNGNCIDIFMDSYDEAINFGRKQVVVYLIEAKG
ncbi:MAG: 3D domain-containing protein, partial [Bacteroidales bacterium]|nr:3D domain-containing protein [Bacteroidales bacterium]